MLGEHEPPRERREGAETRVRRRSPVTGGRRDELRLESVEKGRPQKLCGRVQVFELNRFADLVLPELPGKVFSSWNAF